MLRGDNSYIFLCPAANSSYNLYTSMREKKKLKIPKKLQNTKYKNIVKILLRICIRKVFFFEMPCGDRIQCISLYSTFFLYALRVLIFFSIVFFVMCTMSANFDYIFACWGQNEKLYFDKRILEFY